MFNRSSNTVYQAQLVEERETGAKKLLSHAKQTVDKSKIKKVRIKIHNGYIFTSHPEDWKNIHVENKNCSK